MLKNLAGLQVLKKNLKGTAFFKWNGIESENSWISLLAGYDCKSYRDLWHALVQQSPAGNQQVVSLQPFLSALVEKEVSSRGQLRGGEG